MQVWTDFIRQEASVWDDFHSYWLRKATQLPVHFITYESLLSDPAPALTSLFKFLLDRESLEGLAIEQRIATVC